MANAAEELKGPAGFTWQGYNSAANYALQNKINPAQGMDSCRYLRVRQFYLQIEVTLLDGHSMNLCGLFLAWF